MKNSVMFMLFAVFLGVFASDETEAAIVSFKSKVKWVYPLANGSFVLTFQDAPASCTNTVTPKYFNVVVGQQGVTEQGRNNIYAAALTAAASNASVIVRFDDATDQCFINRLVVEF